MRRGDYRAKLRACKLVALALDLDDVNFDGTQRFAILRRLGTGGMGVVYEAIDREHNGRVALKTFRPISRDAVLRLKDEFRVLQGVHHPNLVRLGELIEDDGKWFFTMELVDGVDILGYVNGHDWPFGSVASEPTLDLGGSQPIEIAHAMPAGKFDEAKLRAVLPQLVGGLDALHAAGKVHRDIKPPNVLVTHDGRVVILDFGLVRNLPRDDESKPRAVVGTVAYMAPEQAAGGHVGAAADWYAVGVLLYEALTRRLPFEGHPMQILVEKQDGEPISPKALQPTVPADLDTLCMELLRPRPEDRLTGAQILDRLAVRPPQGRSRSTSVQPGERLFVGRDEQLAQLATAFTSAADRSVAAIVRGESGVGKSLLVKHFLEMTIDTHPEVIVLSGRCYERESVPYKAFDGIVDELTRFLGRLPPDVLDELLPDHVAFAAQLFPVLRGVDAIANAVRVEDAIDPQQQRTLLFAAIRQLFIALAARFRLILVIDDLQWTDAESLALLRELVRSPAPAILYIATLRATEAAPVAIADIEKTVALVDRVIDVRLGALSSTAAAELVAQLVRRLGVSPSVATKAIAEEAQGHPLFIEELLHHIVDTGDDAATGATQLDDAIMGRVARLDAGQRRLIEIVSVAGRPLSQATIALAASSDFREFSARVDELRAASLIRSSGARRSDAIEPYHDRIRTAVLARLTAPERISIHQQLAISLEATQHHDPETLAIHWRDAGKPERAVAYALSAADQAAAAVAFGRAARLYRLAMDLGLPSPEERGRVAVRFAEALANDGQSPAAAKAYLAALAAVGPAGRRSLTQRAAEQFLRAGHINEGLAHVGTVLADMGMHMPKRPRGALFSLLYQRAALRLRGLGHVERREDEVGADELERIDACWTVALLGFVDTLRGADFGTRHLRLALAAGEPRRLARAVAVEAVYASNIANGYDPRAHELIAMAERLADKSDSPYAAAFVTGASAVVEHALGNFRQSRERAERAEASFRTSCAGVAWELDLVQLIALMCLYYEGNLSELEHRLGPILDDARQRGDLFCMSSVQILIKYRTHLLRDQPDEARQIATAAMANWDQDGFQLQHRHELLAHAEIDLYLGRGGDAYRRFERSWSALKRSLLLKAQQQRLELFDTRARAAIAMSSESGVDAPAMLAVAERHAGWIERARMPWADALAKLLRAGIAERAGKPEHAVALLRTASEGLAVSGMALHTAIARRILGRQLGGDEGRALVAAADTWLVAARVKDTAKVTAALAPGFAMH
jgi:serine/threonine protein kinase